MIVKIYDYTDATGELILEDYEYNKNDAMLLCNVNIITVEDQDYEVFETKIRAYATVLEIAVRKH